MKNFCPSSFTNKRTVWSGVVCIAAREGSLYIHTLRPSKAVGNGTPSIREGGGGEGDRAGCERQKMFADHPITVKEKEFGGVLCDFLADLPKGR